MTTQTIAEQATFATAGTITIANTTWTVGLNTHTGNTPTVPGTWSFTTGAGTNLITWETRTNTTTKDVLAAAPSALLDHFPDQHPALNWVVQPTTQNVTVHKAHLATITTCDGDTVELCALHHPALLELSDPAGMSMFIGTRPYRTLYLPTAHMDQLDLVDLFDRVRTSPRILG